MAETETRHDSWSAGESYEHYMGRWGREIARQFIGLLAAGNGRDWLDIGCGSGALSATILEQCAPASVTGIDPSPAFVDHAAKTITDDRARFLKGGAESLPLEANSVDCCVSGLVLNFVPDRMKALAEMRRVTRPGGRIAFYVWDYPGGGMGFIDAFWRAAASIDPAARDLNEADRFPFCTKEGLAGLCGEAGFANAEVTAIETQTVFADFEAFWHPFTLGAGPAPGYAMALPEDKRAELKAALKRAVDHAGKVRLPARAWAVFLA